MVGEERKASCLCRSKRKNSDVVWGRAFGCGKMALSVIVTTHYQVARPGARPIHETMWLPWSMVAVHNAHAKIR